MKKTSYLWSLAAMCFAVTLSAGFASCGDDDDDPEPTPTPTPVVTDNLNSLGYMNPITSWGVAMSAVKNYMEGYTLYYEGTGTLIYEGKNVEEAYYYNFDDGELVTSEVDLPFDAMTKTKIANMLTSVNYQLVNSVDTVDYYLSANQKTAVMLSTSNYWEVYELIYIDYEWLNSDDPDDPEDPVTQEASWMDPYIVWGAGKTAVKNFMSNYKMYGETDGIIAYYGKDDEDSYWYFFDSAKLVESEVDVPLDVTTLNNLYDKLTADGYQYLGAQPDTVNHFVSEDRVTYIFLVTNSYYGVYEVTYCDYAALSSRSMNNQAAGPAQLNWADFKKDKQQFANKKARKQNNKLANKMNRVLQMRTKVRK